MDDKIYGIFRHRRFKIQDSSALVSILVLCVIDALTLTESWVTSASDKRM